MMTWRNGILFAILIFKSGHVTSIISVRLPPCKSNLHHTTEQHNTNRFPSHQGEKGFMKEHLMSTIFLFP